MRVLQLGTARVEEPGWAARRREDAAFEALVREHQHRVYSFCLRMLGEPEEALDVSQDVFLSVHRHLGTFRGEARLGTWLYRIARNHCLNRLTYLRRRGRGRSEAWGEAQEQALAGALDGPRRPDEALEARAEQARVQRAIAALDDEQRLLVVLRDLEGLSYQELVEVTELPEGTVKSRLHRARERLAALLGGEVDDAA